VKTLLELLELSLDSLVDALLLEASVAVPAEASPDPLESSEEESLHDERRSAHSLARRARGT
jgi:hypothetical protein